MLLALDSSNSFLNLATSDFTLETTTVSKIVVADEKLPYGAFALRFGKAFLGVPILLLKAFYRKHIGNYPFSKQHSPNKAAF